MRALDTDESGVSWTLTGYLVAAAVFTPLMGRLGDMFGKRRLLVVSLLAFATGLGGGRGLRQPLDRRYRARHPRSRGRDLPTLLRHHPRRVSARPRRARCRPLVCDRRNRRRTRPRPRRRPRRTLASPTTGSSGSVPPWGSWPPFRLSSSSRSRRFALQDASTSARPRPRRRAGIAANCDLAGAPRGLGQRADARPHRAGLAILAFWVVLERRTPSRSPTSRPWRRHLCS